MDAQRGIAAEWFAPAAALTFEERLERRIEAELGPRDQRPRDPLAITARDGRNFGRLMTEAEIRRKLEQEEVGEFGSFWDGLA
jgi:hypothetical protein